MYVVVRDNVGEKQQASKSHGCTASNIEEDPQLLNLQSQACPRDLREQMTAYGRWKQHVCAGHCCDHGLCFHSLLSSSLLASVFHCAVTHASYSVLTAGSAHRFGCLCVCMLEIST